MKMAYFEARRAELKTQRMLLENLFICLLTISSFIADIVSTYTCINAGMEEANLVVNFLITYNLFILSKVILFIMIGILLRRSIFKSKDYRKMILSGVILLIGINFLAAILNVIGLCLMV